MLETPQSLIRSVTARIRETMRTESRGDLRQLTFRAMSTPVRVCFREETAALAVDCQHAVLEWVAEFEARYSRFIPESIVGQINARSGGDWLEVDAAAEELLVLCDQMYAATRGVFDAASLPLLRLWNWKSDSPRIPDAASVSVARQLAGWDKVLRLPGKIQLPSPGMGIDLGGIGKEYAVDQVLDMIRQRGIIDVLVDIGQDVRVCGRAPGKDAWYIGLEEPEKPGDCWTSVRVTDHAVATSGDYFRAFTQGSRRYGHILDPRTGEPVDNSCQAVSVIAPTCVLAGVFATAAFILGPVEGLKLVQHYDEAQACITTNAARHQTRRFSSYVPA